MPLTGGLGNQLFQLAAGLERARIVYVTQCLGSPRMTLGKADLFGFTLPPNVHFIDCNKGHRVSGKMFNLLISIGARRNWIKRNRFLTFALRLSSSLIFSIHFKTLLWVTFSREIGFDSKQIKSKGNFIVGYFQSWRYMNIPQVSQKMKNIELKGERSESYSTQLATSTHQTLGLHVRLGDYKHEKSFGVLGGNYFAKALEVALAKQEFDQVWLFSDEPELALTLIPQIPLPVRVVPIKNISSAETLDLLRECACLIISNSTFSWWGAMISRENLVEVIAPTPWFVDVPDPIDLIPNDWTKIDR